MTGISFSNLTGIAAKYSERIGPGRRKTIITVFKLIVAVFLMWRIFLLAYLLRSPLLDDVICDPDVGGAAYSSQFFFAPGSIYRNAVETKPPGAYLLMNLVFKLFGKSMLPVAWLTLAYHCACAVILFLIARRLSGSAAGLTAAFLYSAYSTISAGNGLCANFETWTLLPTLLTFYALLEAYRRKVQPRFLIFFAGLLAASAVMFKQQAAMHVLAFGVALIAATRLAPRSRKTASLTAALFLYAGGGLLLTGVVLAFFAFKGGLAPMIKALNPSNYIGYASTEGWGFLNLQITESLLPFLFNTRTLLLLAFVGFILFFFTKQEDEPNAPNKIFTGAYIAATLLAVFAGTKFFDHYFMLLIPMLALLGGLCAGGVLHNRLIPWALKILLCFLIIPAACNDMKLEIELGREARADIAENGHASWDKQSRFFWTKTTVPRYSSLSHTAGRLAVCIRRHSENGDTLYVWDYIPHLYFYSGMRAPTRHFMYFDVAVDLPPGSGRWHDLVDDRVHDSREKLQSDLAAAKPVNIVYFAPRSAEIPWYFLTDHAPIYTELKRWIDENYVVDPYCKDQYFVVLRRADRLEPKT